MIPTYMLVKSVGLINKPAVMVLVGSISAYNLIIARTFIQNNIPTELLEASRIDGCSDFLYFAKIVLPLSKSVIAVLTLYYAITHWNSYF
ncbi:MAG: ABC transporter permease subunit [Clostridiales bacterium]|nr:MAG: ABC transporter permease subunit [Clostridiales bacterium]